MQETNHTDTIASTSSTPEKKGWKRMALLKNKYLIAIAFFLVWMLFFDVKDIGSSIERWHKYRELRQSEASLSKKIGETKAELGQLKNNAQTIERYAREKYLMKKDNEDLFIVKESPKEK